MNEFDTWAGAKSYFSGHSEIAAGARARLTYAYSTTPYDETQVPKIALGDHQYWSLRCVGETGGPSTAINDSYDGDEVENRTDTFAWSLPGGVVSPIGMGDLVVKRNGVTLTRLQRFEGWTMANTLNFLG